MRGLLSLHQLGGFISLRLSSERKAGQKLGCSGKVKISPGGNVQQQLRPGLSPTLAQPPLHIVLHIHTCQYIHSGHKDFTTSGPLHIQIPGEAHRKRNIPLTGCGMQHTLLLLYNTVCVVRLFPSNCACLFMQIFSIESFCRGTILSSSRS